MRFIKTETGRYINLEYIESCFRQDNEIRICIMSGKEFVYSRHSSKDDARTALERLIVDLRNQWSVPSE